MDDAAADFSVMDFPNTFLTPDVVHGFPNQTTNKNKNIKKVTTSATKKKNNF